jgi:hypothetical protein
MNSIKRRSDPTPTYGRGQDEEVAALDSRRSTEPAFARKHR